MNQNENESKKKINVGEGLGNKIKRQTNIYDKKEQVKEKVRAIEEQKTQKVERPKREEDRSEKEVKLKQQKEYTTREEERRKRLEEERQRLEKTYELITAVIQWVTKRLEKGLRKPKMDELEECHCKELEEQTKPFKNLVRLQRHYTEYINWGTEEKEKHREYDRRTKEIKQEEKGLGLQKQHTICESCGLERKTKLLDKLIAYNQRKDIIRHEIVQSERNLREAIYKYDRSLKEVRKRQEEQKKLIK
ncbi:uncharacterized protein LOC128552492, partial [Mercenaria mercenaria]|uniref:uncharacterized protein LOC128552492 n=1 Tax=Mercenaria mercenaria TaxID=6596 RepID=UPI00234F721A